MNPIYNGFSINGVFLMYMYLQMTICVEFILNSWLINMISYNRLNFNRLMKVQSLQHTVISVSDHVDLDDVYLSD